MIDYKEKYLKYKIKYLNAKKLYGGIIPADSEIPYSILDFHQLHTPPYTDKEYEEPPPPYTYPEEPPAYTGKEPPPYTNKEYEEEEDEEEEDELLRPLYIEGTVNRESNVHDYYISDFKKILKELGEKVSIIHKYYHFNIINTENRETYNRAAEHIKSEILKFGRILNDFIFRKKYKNIEKELLEKQNEQLEEIDLILKLIDEIN